jgi:hypothetical protein
VFISNVQQKWRLSWNVLTYAGFLYIKVAVLRDKIKGTSVSECLEKLPNKPKLSLNTKLLESESDPRY